jgi:hypothetical protein
MRRAYKPSQHARSKDGFRFRSAYATAALLAATVALVACGGGGSTVVRTVAPPTVVVPSSGVSDIDHIVEAAVRGDAIKLAELTGYSHLRCSKQPPSPARVGDPPKCATDQADGTVVEALPVTGCDGGWAQPIDAVDAYRAAIAGRRATLEAAYVPVPPSSPFQAGLHEQYVAVIRVEAEDGSARNVAFHITGGRVSWVENACPPDANLAGPERAQSFLITPTAAPAAAATAEPSSTP